MKYYISYVLAYFIIYFPISVGLEVFVWRDEVLNSSFWLQQLAQAALWALIMALIHVVYKKANAKKVK
ncbi:MAG: hypothetical protein R2800_07700 [Flavipsychrobacter sp.]